MRKKRVLVVEWLNKYQFMDKKILNIILIGNMNNNHFALKRYFTDLGHNCHLYIFSYSPDHFKPENDTWNIEKHQKSITYLDIGKPQFEFYLDKSYKQIFSACDISIGCGLAPYYFQKLGLKLDLFIPYGSDLNELAFKFKINFKSLKKFSQTILHNTFIYKLQRKGIINSKRIISSKYTSYCQNALQKLKLNYLPLPIPMVYLEDPPKNINLSKDINLDRLKNFSFRVFSHSRQYWAIDVNHNTKGNDKLIIGFSYLANEFNDVCLVLFEYGPCIESSKKLIKNLGISDKVFWIKKVPRKYIYHLINEYASVGADQFNSGMHGSSLYEYLAHGKPTLNYISDNPTEYRKYTGFPFPPVINVNSSFEIYKSLSELYSSSDLQKTIGRQSKSYFNKFIGEGNIVRYERLFKEILDEKK